MLRLGNFVYATYTRRLRRQLRTGPLPRHIGVIMDGNRRWARQAGFSDPAVGHRYGGEHILRMLPWCEGLEIGHVTFFVCSSENLTGRADAELTNLMTVVEEVITKQLVSAEQTWRVQLAGDLDLLPDTTARALKQAADATRNRTGGTVTLAVGYGGRQEIVSAVRDLLVDQADAGRNLADVARRLTADDLTRHMGTAGQPDPDLIIRTSGEQRMSNFLMWQSVDAELSFCDVYWPAFRELDLLRAIRTFARRKRARSS